MAFPFPQKQLMERKGTFQVHPALGSLDFMQVTSVPPNKVGIVGILEAHDWFRSIMRSVRIPTVVVYGLQQPPLDGGPSDMKVLSAEGIRVVGLAYQGPNKFGGGFAAPNVPLTDEGRSLLRRMSEAGIAVDLSHAGHRMALDALSYLEYAAFPSRVIVTHSGCYDVHPHLRNFPDEVFRGVAKHRGLIGLPTVTWMLHGSDNTLEPFFQHLDHLLQVVGREHICIGSDGGYYEPLSLEEEQALHDAMTRMLDPTGVIFHARLPGEAEEIHHPKRLEVLAERIAKRYKSWGLAERIVGGNLYEYGRKFLC